MYEISHKCIETMNLVPKLLHKTLNNKQNTDPHSFKVLNSSRSKHCCKNTLENEHQTAIILV